MRIKNWQALTCGMLVLLVEAFFVFPKWWHRELHSSDLRILPICIAVLLIGKGFRPLSEYDYPWWWPRKRKSS
jgi:hypothetical protein